MAGRTPGPARDDANVARLLCRTPLGTFAVVATRDGLREVHLPRARTRRFEAPPAGEAAEIARRAAAELGEYVAGERTSFDVPLDWSRVPSDHGDILRTLRDVAPYGTVITYGEVARAAGRPGEARAVGRAMATNPLPLVVPCHRVVAANGLGGYGGGLPLKRRLLALEGVLASELPLTG